MQLGVDAPPCPVFSPSRANDGPPSGRWPVVPRLRGPARRAASEEDDANVRAPPPGKRRPAWRAAPAPKRRASRAACARRHRATGAEPEGATPTTPFTRRTPRRAIGGVWIALLSFLSPSAHEVGESHGPAGLPHPPRCAPRFSQPPGASLPLRRSGMFRPVTLLGFSPLRGFPPRVAEHLSAGRAPRAVRPRALWRPGSTSGV